jgi:hypothetical protein
MAEQAAARSARARERPVEPLPMVLLVHGGPWGRDVYGYHADHHSNCFATSALLSVLTPVTFPPGRLKLATRPSLMGSPPVKKTIGIVAVAALAARAALLAIAKITTTCCRTWLGQTDEHVRRGELFDEP